MQLIWIAYCIGNISDRQVSQFEKFCRFYHTVVHQELLGRFSDGFFKDPSEIAPVQPAEFCNALHGYIVLEILFDIGQRFLDIEISHPSFRGELHGRGGAGEIVDEQIEVSDKMKGRLAAVFGNIQELFFHAFTQIF